MNVMCGIQSDKKTTQKSVEPNEMFNIEAEMLLILTLSDFLLRM